MKKKDLAMLTILVGIGLLLLSASGLLLAGGWPAPHPTDGVPTDGPDATVPATATLGPESTPTGLEAPTDGASPTEPSATTPPTPTKPASSAVPTPGTGPAVAQVKKVDGIPRLFINGKENPPLMLFGNASYAYYKGTTETLENEWRFARDNGVNIVSVNIEPSWMIAYNTFNTGDIDAALMSAISEHPNAFIVLRVALSLSGSASATDGAHKRWLAAHPDDRVRFADGTTTFGGEEAVSVASDAWFSQPGALNDAKDILEKVIDYISADPVYGPRVIAYHPTALSTGEWFNWGCREKGVDLSVTNTKKFRVWLKDKYGSDLAALRSAWADGSVTFDGASIPVVPGNGGASETRTVLDQPGDRRFLDFYEYNQWLITTRIHDFAKIVKDRTANRALVVNFYGYETEVVTPISGHFDFAKLLADPLLDAFASPISYHDRNEGGLGAFMAPVDAVQSAGKLWIVESDIRTKTDGSEPDASYNPACASIPDAIEVHRREMGAIMVRGAGTWWMDLWGSGWLDDARLWQNLSGLHPLYQKYVAQLKPKTGEKTAYRPQVAVILDEDGMYRFAMPMRTGADLLFYSMREELYRSGLTFGYYTTADLAKGNVPSSARLLVFPAAFHIDDAEMSAIRSHQGGGRTLLFLTGFGDNDASRVKELTGMDLASTTTASTRIVLNGSGHALAAGLTSISPDFFAKPSWTVTGGGVVLGTSGTLNTFACRDNGDWKAVYAGTSRPTREFLRNAARYAGANVYLDSGDVVFGNDELIVVHTRKGVSGSRTVRFGRTVDVYDYFSKRWYEDVSSVTVSLAGAKTAYFFFGEKSALLAKGLPGIG